MICHVLTTAIDGRRLSRDEQSQRSPVVGNLVIRDWTGSNGFKRAVRIAELKSVVSWTPDALKPLFDPSVVKMTDSGFLIVGTELDCRGGEMFETLQGWWCRPSINAAENLCTHDRAHGHDAPA